MEDEIQKELNLLRSLPDNRRCFDCDSTPATWASLHYGVFLCMNCAGIHREMTCDETGFGAHITLVRSLELDHWNKKYCTFMKLGGNRRAREHFGHVSVLPQNRIEKYLSEEATRYKQILKSEVYSQLGLPPDPEIPYTSNKRVHYKSSDQENFVSPRAVMGPFQRESPLPNNKNQICPIFCTIL